MSVSLQDIIYFKQNIYLNIYTTYMCVYIYIYIYTHSFGRMFLRLTYIDKTKHTYILS